MFYIQLDWLRYGEINGSTKGEFKSLSDFFAFAKRARHETKLLCEFGDSPKWQVSFILKGKRFTLSADSMI